MFAHCVSAFVATCGRPLCSGLQAQALAEDSDTDVRWRAAMSLGSSAGARTQ